MQQARLFCRTLGRARAFYRICPERHGEAMLPIFIDRGAAMNQSLGHHRYALFPSAPVSVTETIASSLHGFGDIDQRVSGHDPHLKHPGVGGPGGRAPARRDPRFPLLALQQKRLRADVSTLSGWRYLSRTPLHDRITRRYHSWLL